MSHSSTPEDMKPFRIPDLCRTTQYSTRKTGVIFRGAEVHLKFPITTPLIVQAHRIEQFNKCLDKLMKDRL